MKRRRFIATLAAGAIRLDARETLVRDMDELNAAIRGASAGDVLRMAAGTWKDADILLTGDGVTLCAEQPGAVSLTGRSRVRIAGRALTVRGLRFEDGYFPGDVISFRASPTQVAVECRVTECAIVDYNVPDRERDTKWISVDGFRNRVDHCYLAGKTNAGATLVIWLPASSQPSEHRLDGNHFGPRPPLGFNGGETIRVGDSATSMQVSRTLVEQNLFEACNGEIEVISNKSCENIYRGNVFERCEGTLTLRHGNRCRVDGNWFFGRGARNTGGVRIIGEDHWVVNNYFDGLTGSETRAALAFSMGMPDSPLNGYFQVQRAVVSFNTVVSCAQAIMVGSSRSIAALTLPPMECLIANNLLTGTVRDPGDAAIEWANNLTEAAMSDVAGMKRPAADSILRGTATDAGAVDHDIDREPRGDARDVGCDQWSDTPPARRAAFGPLWRSKP